MSSVFAPRPDDRPPKHESWGTGVTISIAAHLALIGALIWGVHWRSSNEPQGASAELWSAVPEAAAPPPVSTPVETPPPPVPQPPVPAPPPPPVAEAPRPPDIVTERLEEKKKLEKAKADQEKIDKAKLDQQKADKAKAEAQKQLDAQKLAKLHDENVKRMMGQMDAPADSTGAAARNSGPSASYGGRIKARIYPNIVLTDTVAGNPTTEVEVRCAPDGTIIGRRITQSSGVKEWDDAVVRAIDRTAILPRDTDGRVPSPILITFRPQDVGH